MNEPTPVVFEEAGVYPSPVSSTFAISRYKGGRHWAIHDPDGALVCVALYKKGANEVARRLNAAASSRTEP